MKYSAIPPAEFKWYTRTWKTPAAPIATVVFHHGFAEYIDRYEALFSEIAASGIEVFGYDARGFGHNVEKHQIGCNGGWNQQQADLDYHLVQHRKEGIPQFLWGHSMGGGAVLKYGIDGAHAAQLAGVIASAPLVELAKEAMPNGLVLKAGALLAKLMPDMIIPAGVSADHCSRDPAVREAIKTDDLLAPRQYGSLRGIGDMLTLGPKLCDKNMVGRWRTTLPLLVYHGDADKINSHIAAKRFVERCPAKDKTYTEYPEMYHELHNDFGKEKVIEETKNWLLSHVRSSSQEHARL